MIVYRHTTDGITAEQLAGFFNNFAPNHPTPETHLELLKHSAFVQLALDDDVDRVVGFITAISDGVLSAYIPLLEVLPEYQGRGIGTELTRRMFEQLKHLYMVDLCCDEDLKPFYERLGMTACTGMVIRNFDRQTGSQ